MTQRDEILDSACELYVEEGPDGLTMRRVADEVGVTPGALYRHYDGKEAVLQDLVGRAHGTLLQHLIRALRGGSPAERMWLAEREYLEFALEEPRLYEVYYATPELMGVDELPEETATRARAIRQFWEDRVSECVEAGLLRDREHGALGLTLWSHAHGLLSLYHRGMLGVEAAEFRDLFLRSRLLALRGVAPESAHDRLEAVWGEAAPA